MISLEQVRQLDIRVKKAVTAVKKLSSENTALKQQVTELETHLDELRKEAFDRKADEEQLEMSFQGVLDVLDEVNGETSELEPEPPADQNVVETMPEAEKSPLEEDDNENDILFSAEAEEDAVETETDESDKPAAAESQEENIEPEEAVDKPEDVDPDSGEDRIQSEFDIF
ncbi:MAG: cell division protein ZapB [Spirochaetaceae bacterium]|nr:cell division protein ZapB [Spirochaetaceae bacterium]